MVRKQRTVRQEDPRKAQEKQKIVNQELEQHSAVSQPKEQRLNDVMGNQEHSLVAWRPRDTLAVARISGSETKTRAVAAGAAPAMRLLKVTGPMPGASEEPSSAAARSGAATLETTGAKHPGRVGTIIRSSSGANTGPSSGTSVWARSAPRMQSDRR